MSRSSSTDARIRAGQRKSAAAKRPRSGGRAIGRAGDKGGATTERESRRPEHKRAGVPRVGRRRRRHSADARRQTILKAALEVFAAQGFAASRLDDVAARAGVAKGTLYLYFADKEALFEQLIRSAAAPVLDRVAVAATRSDVRFADLLQEIFDLFRTEVLGTERKLILQLILTEGARFPAIAEFYYREIVARMMGRVRGMAQRASQRGELPSDAVARFPQLVAAPLLMSVLWDALFSRFDPLDVERLLEAHREVLLGRGSARP